MAARRRTIERARRCADGGVIDDMSPVDLARLRAELGAKSKPMTVDERWSNYTRTGSDIAGVLPVIGNVMSARDAVTSAQDTAAAYGEGRPWATAGNAALTGLGALGTVTGLPWGRGAREAARTGASTARIFAGPKARTANTVALAKAEGMRAGGDDPADILRETGWFWGADGQPRFEIDDSAVRAIGGKGTAATQVPHPELYAAYPELAKLRTRVRMGGGEHAEIGRDILGRRRMLVNSDTEGATPLALHELQHGVQQIEGRTSGTNPMFAKDNRSSSELAELRETATPFDKIMLKSDGYGAYWRNAGEVEARNVESRAGMSAPERRMTPAWETQDVLDSQQIYGDRSIFGITGIGGRKVFAGPKAKTADLRKLRQAELMREDGNDPETILRHTGWFWGHDGKPRFEIDDSRAALDFENLGPQSRPMSDVLVHPELYAAYPGAAKIRTSSATADELGPGVAGDYSEGYHSTYFPDSSIPGQIRLSNEGSVTDKLSTSLHEVQHDIQNLEGFAPGGNQRTVRDHRSRAERDAMRDRLLERAERLRQAGDRSGAENAWLQARQFEQQAEWMKQRGWGAYYREAGEVEARNVQMRRDMSPDERIDKMPWTTEDIIPEAIIVQGTPSTGSKRGFARGGKVAGRERGAAASKRDRIVRRARAVSGGAIEGTTGGREDAHAVDVPAGSYVVPADVVAALGGGNTKAGMHQLDAFHDGRSRRARGGRASHAVPIMISDGEYLLPPEAVEQMGGADSIDRWIVQTRNQYAEHLRQLPGPRTD